MARRTTPQIVRAGCSLIRSSLHWSVSVEVTYIMAKRSGLKAAVRLNAITKLSKRCLPLEAKTMDAHARRRRGGRLCRASIIDWKRPGGVYYWTAIIGSRQVKVGGALGKSV